MSAPRETKELANLIWEVVGRRYRYASTYYVLYWLSEVKGYDAAEFDYAQLNDKLARGLYWYGVYAVTREALHFGNTVRVEGRGMDGSVGEIYNMGGGEDRALAALRNTVGRGASSNPAVSAAVDLLSEDADVVKSQLPRGGAARVDLTKFWDTADTAFPVLSDTDSWLMGLSSLFNDVLQGPPGRTTEPELWWEDQYGGPMWGRATDHLLRMDDLSDAAWIDQTFAIEHNTGNWLDKVMLQAEQSGKLQPVTTYRGTFPEGRVMERILDAARDEEMDKLFSVAVQFEDELDVSLTRAARLYDISTNRSIYYAPSR